MKETKLLAEGIPMVPEYLKFLATLREKYDIPLLGPDVDVEILPGLLGLDFEPEMVKKEIIEYLN